jgi:integrase
MFNIARADKKIRDVPRFPMLKEPPPRSGFFEHAKFLALSAALPDYVRPVLAIGYHTGMRKREILTLRWSQVDFLAGLIRLNAGETKNDEGRKIPVFGELAAVLRAQYAKRRPDCELVCSRVEKGRALGIGDFRKVWEGHCVTLSIGRWVQVCRKHRCSGYNKPLAGDAKQCPACEGSTKLKYFGSIFHDLRRTGVRNLVRAGVPESVAMAITGHKTRSVFDRYDITSEKDVKDAGAKLETYYAGQKGENSGQMAESAPPEDSAKSLPVM